MKLLRFGFENETMPTTVSVVCGIMADPIGTFDDGEWKNASKGGEGKYFRQDVTDLNAFSGAYSYVPGREHPNTTCIAGFSPNEDASNLSDAAKNVFFNWQFTNQHLNQYLKVNFPASQGIGLTYFYKINKVIGMDTTGVQLPNNEQADYLFKRTDDDFQEDMAADWYFSKYSSWTYWQTNPGFMIPNRYHGDTPMGGAYNSDSERGNLPCANKTHMETFPRGCAAGFYFSALDGATPQPINDYNLANTMGGSAYVNTLTMILNGEKQDFTLGTNLNLSGWNSVQVKYCTAPNHVFKVSINGEDFQMYGNSNKPASSVIDTFLIPMTANMMGQNVGTTLGNQGKSARLPNTSFCIDDIALNNNIIDVDGGLQISDSDIIIPPFVVCTGLDITSEVAGGEFSHDQEASSVFDAIKSNNDIRVFTNKSAVHRFNLEKVHGSLTGLEAVNVYAKNANINFPSTLRYLGFGLESGSELLMSDAAAHQLRPLSATERDGSISLMPDKDAKNIVQDLTTEKFNNDCTIYIESRKQIGLNFFGNADFNGTQDQRFHVLNFHAGGSVKYAQNKDSRYSKKWPYGEQARTDGNLILETNTRSDISNNADLSNPTIKAHAYRTAVINPVSLRNGVAEVHCKNFIVKKDTHVAIPIGNTRDGGTQRYRDGKNNNYPSIHGALEYDSSTQTVGMSKKARYNQNTNISQSVIIIYAQENIYIDGDVYFEYGNSNFHAPNEHSYHSKNNRFSLVKFTGDGLIDFDMDNLRRLTNTSPSESSYQQVPAAIYDYGDPSTPANSKVKAVDFSLEAGERQGVVIHGSGGSYGDVYGKRDGVDVQLNGQAAIGWGCGGGGGLVTGWNGLLPGYRYVGQGNGGAIASRIEPMNANMGYSAGAYPINERDKHHELIASDWYMGNLPSTTPNSYIHHGIAALWRELFVSGNPNLGFRYYSCARSGSEGGPWGGGRGASWTHKDPIAGVGAYINHKNTNQVYNGYVNVSARDHQAGNDLNGGHGAGNRYAFGSRKEGNEHVWKEYLDGGRLFFHMGDPTTGYEAYKFHATNYASNTADNVGTREFLTRRGYAALDGTRKLGANGANLGSFITNTNYWKGDDLSPSLLNTQVYQFEKGANTASTAGRAGGGAPIVYLVAGGDIVIGTNGSVNAKGTNPLGIVRNTYNIPAALNNKSANVGAFSASPFTAASAEDTFVQSLGHIDGYDKGYNYYASDVQQYATNHTNIDGGYFGRAHRPSLMGHGGGGGGCITFLHGGLFSNQGTVNVDGGNPADTERSLPGYWWNWTGQIAEGGPGDLLSFWGQARRDFDFWPGNSGVARTFTDAQIKLQVGEEGFARMNAVGVMQPQGILNSREQFKVVDHTSTPMYHDSSLTSAPAGGAGAWRSFKVVGPKDVRRKLD